MGMKVTEQGVSPLESTVWRVRNFPKPGNRKELQSFLGLVRWVAAFMPGLSQDEAVLSDCLRVKSGFNWGKEQEVAFEKVRSSLTTSALLVHPDWARRWVLVTDASDWAMYGILYQMHEDGTIDGIITSCGRKFSNAEIHYDQGERECLAVVYCCDKLSWSTNILPYVWIIKHSRRCVRVFFQKSGFYVGIQCFLGFLNLI